jgi:hypothetical protein
MEAPRQAHVCLRALVSVYTLDQAASSSDTRLYLLTPVPAAVLYTFPSDMMVNRAPVVPFIMAQSHTVC